MSITQNKVRGIAGLLAIAVWVTLAARLWLTATEENLSYLGAAWHDLRYFTIWTNTLIGAVCIALALGWRVPQWMSAGMALSIALVAGVYHALLAAGRNLVGLDWAIHLMLHTVIPAGFIAFWVFVLPKVLLAWRDLIIWSSYPVLYSIYAIGRGQFDGVYPYFFLDVAKLGALGVGAWIAGLAAVFLVVGAVVIAIARRVARVA